MVTVVEDEGIINHIFLLQERKEKEMDVEKMEREREGGREGGREGERAPVNFVLHLQCVHKGCHKVLHREECLKSHFIEFIHQTYYLGSHGWGT